MAASDGDDGGGGTEWRFGVDDVGEEAEEDRAVDPGEPTAEGTLFFLAGVGLTLALLATLVV